MYDKERGYEIQPISYLLENCRKKDAELTAARVPEPSLHGPAEAPILLLSSEWNHSEFGGNVVCRGLLLADC